MDDFLLNDNVASHPGFPNAATDEELRSLDLHKLLIHRPLSTFYFRIRGDAWQSIGIFDGSIAVVDRAVAPQKNDLVVWWDEADFMISTRQQLNNGGAVWGTITAVIRQLRTS